MEVILRDIDETNWLECIRLTTDPMGRHVLFEEFVASNAVSIAQSAIQEGWIPKAIYDGDLMVGFTMYGYSPDLKAYEICRLMVDHRYQKRGYGRKALELVLEDMMCIRGCREVYLSFEPSNGRGRKLYSSFGFRDTGRIVDGELLYRLELVEPKEELRPRDR